MSNFNIEVAESQDDQREENYGYKRSSVTDLEVLTYCPTCRKRLTTGDELYIDSFDIFCGESCANELRRQEREAG